MEEHLKDQTTSKQNKAKTPPSLKKEDRPMYVNKLNELRENFRKLRFELKLGQLDDTSKLKKTRKEIARVQTQISAIAHLD